MTLNNKIPCGRCGKTKKKHIKEEDGFYCFKRKDFKISNIKFLWEFESSDKLKGDGK